MLGAFNYNDHHHIGQANLIQFTIGIIFNNNYTESKTLLEIRQKKVNIPIITKIGRRNINFSSNLIIYIGYNDI